VATGAIDLANKNGVSRGFTDNDYNNPGTAGRDILRGPGSSNIDLALFKSFALGERFRLEARVQAYNLTNAPHFANPNSVLGQWDVQGCNPATSSQPCVNVDGVSKQLIANLNTSFGFVTSTQPNSFRTVELVLRLTF